MDDILILESSLLSTFINILGNTFDIKYLGPLRYIFWLQVICDSNCLCINQDKYDHDFLVKQNMIDYKLESTPLTAKVALTAQDDSLLASPTTYREIVGFFSTSLSLSQICHWPSTLLHNSWALIVLLS